MVLEHLFDFVEEDTGLGLGGLCGVIPLLLPSTEEDFAFGKKGAQGGSKDRDTGSGPEECAPGGVGNEVEVDDCGDEVADSVSLLEDAAGKTTGLDGEVL